MSDDSKTPTDTDNGFNKIPDRYAGDGREVVDQWRDKAWESAGVWCRGYPRAHRIAYANNLFAFACTTHAMKYRVRAGAKGDPNGDAEKFSFYTMLARHAASNGAEPDPRCNRPGFVPYTYPED